MGLSGHLDTPPPQTQIAIQNEQWFTVRLLLEFCTEELLCERSDVDSLVDTPAVLEPVRSPHSHGQIDRGQHTQHWANNQSCGVAIVHHGLKDSLDCLQTEKKGVMIYEQEWAVEINMHPVVVQPQRQDSKVTVHLYSSN